MDCCKEHFTLFCDVEPRIEHEAQERLHSACLDCQAETQRRVDETQQNHTIDPKQGYGVHIALTCANHPELRWHTKNIDFIGARSIFYATTDAAECLCPGADLQVVKVQEDLDAWAELTEWEDPALLG